MAATTVSNIIGYDMMVANNNLIVIVLLIHLVVSISGCSTLESRASEYIKIRGNADVMGYWVGDMRIFYLPEDIVDKRWNPDKVSLYYLAEGCVVDIAKKEVTARALSGEELLLIEEIVPKMKEDPDYLRGRWRSMFPDW